MRRDTEPVRICEPLGMRDTGFSLPEDKLERLATCYQADPQCGALAIFDEARGGRSARPPAFGSGGGGLASAADDDLAVGQMLLEEGRGASASSRGSRSSS